MIRRALSGPISAHAVRAFVADCQRRWQRAGRPKLDSQGAQVLGSPRMLFAQRRQGLRFGPGLGGVRVAWGSAVVVAQGVAALLGLMCLTWTQKPCWAGERATEKPAKPVGGAGSVAGVPGIPGVTVDWQRGVLEASASAAADLYAASVDVARLKAERLARARAEERLRRAVAALQSDARLTARLGSAGPAALDVRSAEVRFIDYGSNGSVVLRLSLALTPSASPAAKSPGSAANPGSVDGGAAHEASPPTSERSENEARP